MDWQATLALWLDEDWVRLLLLGLGAIAISVLGWYQERRRKHRSNPDAVPWLPWRDISFWSSFAALMSLGGALLFWLRT
ncbi:MAG: hypothetical protein C0515_11025 [Novosphingobium sp.]|nr:hypothetical protein [Novosphingobium sp.]MBX9644181.1 hypothetical protein [Novosphingobium sp.]